MAKRHTFKKVKPGEPIPVTARQLESFMFEHNGKFNSRDYDKLERMELTYSPVREPGGTRTEGPSPQQNNALWRR